MDQSNKKKLKKLAYSLAILVVSLAIVELFVYSSNDASEEPMKRHFKESYRIFSLDIPESLNFCNEDVPIENFDVRERFDRELLVNTYWQSQTILFIKRSNRYFKVIEPILEEEGVPNDFKYLALIESGLTNVVSPAGATGFWQIMKSTGLEKGLVINNYVDERYHLKKSTRVACKYLKEAHEEFGNWTLAAASYNMGINGVRRQLKLQKAHGYYDLELNEETARYVYRILAAKEIISNAREYGFNVKTRDLYQHIPTKTVVVDSSITDLVEAAENWGLSYKYLKLFNPWLSSNSLPNADKHTFEFDLPVEGDFGLIQEQIDHDFIKASTVLGADSSKVAESDSLVHDNN